MYQSSRVFIGPGTLYAAPLGTAEPTTISGAWPAGWSALGYTEQGSEFTFTVTTAEVEVEEEIYPIRNVITMLGVEMVFALAETTQQNFLLVVNAGIGSTVSSNTSGTNADGSEWAEPPTPGNETRVMLGWDAIPKAGTSTSPTSNEFGRLVVRQALQSGAMKVTRRKGNNKSVYAATFKGEIPTTAGNPNGSYQPFRMLWPASLVA